MLLVPVLGQSAAPPAALRRTARRTAALPVALLAAVLQHHAGHLTSPTAFLVGVLLVLATFAATFFGAAVVAGALERLDGGPRHSARRSRPRGRARARSSAGAAVDRRVARRQPRRGAARPARPGRRLVPRRRVGGRDRLRAARPRRRGTGPIEVAASLRLARQGPLGQAVGVLFLPAWLVLIVVTIASCAVSPVLGVTVGVVGFPIIAVLTAGVSGIARAALCQDATSGQSPLLDPQPAPGRVPAAPPAAGIGGFGGFRGGGF